MASTRVVRLPLQIGTSSVWSAARAAAAIVPAGMCVALAVYAIISYARDGLEADEWTAMLLSVLVPLAAGIVLGVYAGLHVWLAVRERANDALLGPDGLRIDGGRAHGFFMTWPDLASRGCDVHDVNSERLTFIQALGIILVVIAAIAGADGSGTVSDDKTRVRVLRIRGASAGGDGGKRDHRDQIAEAEDEHEQASLTALFESIQAAAKRTIAPHAAPAGATELLTCETCGGTVEPGDGDTVACPHCAKSVAIPRKIHAHVHAATELAVARSASEPRVAALLDQPGAATTNWFAFAGAVAMLAAWPAAIAAGVHLSRAGRLDVVTGLEVGVFPFAMIVGLWFLLRGRLVDRQALRLITLDFAAAPPAATGEPRRCRHCMAPLVEHPDVVVLVCAHCSAENIIGLDLAPEAKAATALASSLERALARRRRDRLLWRALSAAAAALVGLGVLLLWRILRA